MAATLTQATDDILSMFKTAWEVPGAASDLGGATYVPAVYPRTTSNTEYDDTTEERVQVAFTNSGQGQHTGIGSGTGRYTKSGTVFFSIFTVKGLGPDRANALAQQIVNAFDGKTSGNGVVFNSTSVENVDDEKLGWDLTNVVVSFEFDEFK